MPRRVLIFLSRLPRPELGSSCSDSKLLYQQTAAHDQVPLGVQKALDFSTESDTADGQEMLDDKSITQQAAAGITGITFSPRSFYNF